MAELPAVFRWNASQNSGIQPHKKFFNAEAKGCRSDHHTSLPPLPQLPFQTPDRCKRWGEDAILERNGFAAYSSGFAGFRHNFDNCHPVQQPVGKYDNGMFPKALYTDLSLFHQSAGSTARHVPQPKRCEVFHTVDPNRTNQDARFPLNEVTRRALGNYCKKFYCSSRYEDMFQDTSEFMAEKLQRNAQYYEECVKHNKSNEAPTCCRILNHPDPCHWCWNGGFNKDFEEKLTQFQSKLLDITKCDSSHCTGDSSMPCKCCHSDSCRNKDSCLRPMSAGKVLADAGDSSNTCADRKCKGGGQPEQPEGFGPWKRDERLGDYEDSLIRKSVCQPIFPSALYYRQTHNDQTSAFPENHYQTFYCGIPEDTLFPWTFKSRVDMDYPNTDYFRHNQIKTMSQPDRHMAEIPKAPFYGDSIEADRVPYNPRNTCTFRDENNLRIPCISNVIGNKQKTEAHKRYHAEHSEPIPDLRDSYRYSRRVTFHGYNTSVFR